MKAQIETITIWGSISGNIWMPCERCEKSFKQVYTPSAIHRFRPFTNEWTGLRDAVCDITNDSDFRSAGIDFAYIEVRYRTSDDEIKTKMSKLKAGKLIADCFNTED